MYSLGCTIYAVHAKGNPPYKTHASLGGLRENAGKPIPGMGGWDPDLQGVWWVMSLCHLQLKNYTYDSPSAPAGNATCNTAANSWYTTFSSIFFISSNIYTQLSRSIQFHGQNTRRKNIVHERLDLCFGPVLGRASDTQNFALSAGRGV